MAQICFVGSAHSTTVLSLTNITKSNSVVFMWSKAHCWLCFCRL